MSDQVGNQNVGFLMTRLICNLTSVLTETMGANQSPNKELRAQPGTSAMEKVARTHITKSVQRNSAKIDCADGVKSRDAT